jgi:hypothetical protein
VNGSGINPAWQREYFIRHRICVCSPEQECRHCDGGAAYSSDLAAIAAAVATVTQRELDPATPERRSA